jgi:hypothetical protein
MIKKYERVAKFAELNPYCHLCKPDDFMEVCEWRNSEGFDVVINSKGEQRFSLTWGQWEALQVLVNYKE